MTGVSVRPANVADLPAVADLLMAQEKRQFANSTPHLAIHSRQQIEATLTSQWNKDIQPLVVLNREGKVRAYAHPSVWKLKERSILLSFLSACNGYENPPQSDTAYRFVNDCSCLSFARKLAGEACRFPAFLAATGTPFRPISLNINILECL
jgi:hypothetical protein